MPAVNAIQEDGKSYLAETADGTVAVDYYGTGGIIVGDSAQDDPTKAFELVQRMLDDTVRYWDARNIHVFKPSGATMENGRMYAKFELYKSK